MAHPSLTNYLETVGGSNFGVHSDNPPDWHNGACATNLSTGTVNTDSPASPAICPIHGSGTDAATPVLDCTNEVTGPPCEINLDGKTSYPAVSTTLGITIADQLAAAGKTWKTYQENLPMTGPDLVNYSDGNFTNNTNFTKINPQLNPPLTTGDIVQLYASKHNPFVYFQDVQQGTNPEVSYAQMAGFDGVTRPVGRSRFRQSAQFLLHRAQPVQRPARAQQRNGLLRIRSQRQRHAGRPQPRVDPSGRPGGAENRHRDSQSPACGARATPQSSWFGMRTTTPSNPSSTRS